LAVGTAAVVAREDTVTGGLTVAGVVAVTVTSGDHPPSNPGGITWGAIDEEVGAGSGTVTLPCALGGVMGGTIRENASLPGFAKLAEKAVGVAAAGSVPGTSATSTTSALEAGRLNDIVLESAESTPNLGWVQSRGGDDDSAPPCDEDHADVTGQAHTTGVPWRPLSARTSVSTAPVASELSSPLIAETAVGWESVPATYRPPSGTFGRVTGRPVPPPDHHHPTADGS
jgi:hypothetical protein